MGAIPNDVPRGYLAVYVGDDCKRYVISVALLKHPLFETLLNQAEEIFGFSTGSKLRIPCDESIFVSVLNCVKSQQNYKFLFCLWDDTQYYI